MKFALVAFVLVACRPHAVTPPRALMRTVQPIAAGAKLVELGDATFAIAPTEIAIVRGGVAIARQVADRPRAIGAVGTLPAPTGEGTWVVAVLDGVLDHVTATGEVEAIGDRVGARAAPRQIVRAGRTFALLEPDALAVSTDGLHVERYQITGVATIAIARRRLAIAFADHVEIWDLATRAIVQFAIAHAQLGFVDADSDAARLVVASGAAVFVEDRAGALQRRAAPALIAALAIAGPRAWAWAGDRLYAVDAGGREATLTATDVTGAAPALVGSPTGDAWAIAGTTATRLSTVSLLAPDAAAWQTDVAPVFARVCAHCHLPGGDAGVDLSTVAAWRAERDALRDRVVATKTMPPEGTPMSDVDRSALAAWLAR